MRIPRVFTPQNLSAAQTVFLEPEASHHLLKVLRMSVGRELRLFNGDGNEYTGTLVEAQKKIATVAIGEVNYDSHESPLKSELAIALSKGDRFEWVLQKACELGVTTIQPLFSARSEVKLNGDRLDKKISSWEKIIIGACEQSQRNILPTLAKPLALESFVSTCQTPAKFILHHHSEGELTKNPRPDAVCFLIGPEGGFAESELEFAQASGFKTLRLGARVMRTETAPIAALSLAQYLWGDFN